MTGEESVPGAKFTSLGDHCGRHVARRRQGNISIEFVNK